MYGTVDFNKHSMRLAVRNLIAKRLSLHIIPASFQETSTCASMRQAVTLTVRRSLAFLSAFSDVASRGNKLQSLVQHYLSHGPVPPPT